MAKKRTNKTAADTSEPVDLTGVTIDAPVAHASDSEPRTSEPTYEQIAEAAYQRYLSRGGGDGMDFEDWLEAERDLRSRR
jgi:hypothetical protein